MTHLQPAVALTITRLLKSPEDACRTFREKKTFVLKETRKSEREKSQ